MNQAARHFPAFHRAALLFTLSLWVGLPVVAIAESGESDFESIVLPFLKANCTDCHGEEKSKGDLRLHDISADLANSGDLERWQNVLEQLTLGEMPPEKRDRPDPKKLSAVIKWIESELAQSGNVSDLAAKFREPGFGNYVSHEKLFSGDVQTKAFSPSRLWKRNPNEFDYSKHYVFGEPRYSMFHMPTTGFGGRESTRKDSLPAVKQAFALEDKHGFNDYAALLYADSSTLDTLMRNAGVIADTCLEGAVKELELQEEGLTLKEWREQISAQNRVFTEKLRELARRKNLAVKNDPKSAGALDLRTEYTKLRRSWTAPKVKDTLEEFRAIAMSEGVPPDELIHRAVSQHFNNIVQRAPSAEELSKYVEFFKRNVPKAGNVEALRLTLMAVIISPEAVYRMELGLGEKDTYGRQMLSPLELAFAISLALTDAAPDDTLIRSAKEGRLKSREDVRREVVRLLEDEQTQRPRILRFFHEYFDYHKAPSVFKDDKRFHKKAPNYGPKRYAERLVTDTDVLVMHILEKDRDVLKELLTTDRYFVHHKGNNERAREEAEAIEKFYQYFKDKDWKNFEYKLDPGHVEFTRSISKPYFFKAFFFQTLNGNSVKFLMTYFEKCDKAGITPDPLFAFDKHSIGSAYAYNLDPETWDYPVEQPFQLPGERVGILSHPSWLIAHSLNLSNDPIRRGKWILERLLGGTVPDVPITVDASIPEDPHLTLRERLNVTEAKECWKCHKRMNPLGYTFESFNDFGILRDSEPLELLEKVKGEYQVKAIDARGALDGTGNDDLDGEIKDHADLMHRLAASERVRQTFVRHAFRYWMGRNELLSDSQVLIEADKAYTDNDGSFKALVISLLTSDSFLYRKALD